MARVRSLRAKRPPVIAPPVGGLWAVVTIGCPGCAELQWLERSEARSDIECPRSGTARPVAERYPLLIAG